MSENNPFKNLDKFQQNSPGKNPFEGLEGSSKDDSPTGMKPEIRSLIWQRTRSNLGVVEMLLNVMDLFFVKAGATLTQSFGPQDETPMTPNDTSDNTPESSE